MIAMVTQKGKNEVILRIDNIVQDLVNSPKLKDLDDSQLEQIAKRVLVSELEKELSKEIQKSKINLSRLINRWLKNSIPWQQKEPIQSTLTTSWPGKTLAVMRKREGAKRTLCTLAVLRETCLRVGSLSFIEI
jgi:hypothetical protein